MKNRFLIFQYDSYYPAGGTCDLQFKCDTIDEVIDYLNENKSRYEFYNVFDCELSDTINEVIKKLLNK